jgi:hypothetical protein
MHAVACASKTFSRTSFRGKSQPSDWPAYS